MTLKTENYIIEGLKFEFENCILALVFVTLQE